MVRERIVVGSTGPDGPARGAARRLRDAGHEVVFVGGGQTPEQLVRTMVAEDATSIVVDGDVGSVARIAELGAEIDADVVVTPLGEMPDDLRSR